MPHSPTRFFVTLIAFFLTVLAAGCSGDGSVQGSASAAAERTANCAPDNDGLTLPDGFCAEVVADSVGPARHLAVRDNGDLYVALREAHEDTLGQGRGEGVLVALRDTTGDGRADRIQYFGGEDGGTGIGLRDGHLYASTTEAVRRYPLADGQFVPDAAAETIVENFPEQDQHAAKSFAFDNQGQLYVNIGAPSNACQEPSRTKGVAGQDPCPLLEEHGGIWRFAADRPGQQAQEGTRYVTGTRNVVALTWNDADSALYLVQHGRDQLHQFWPDLYTEKQSAELPAEEFARAEEGTNLGWPYCYYDWQKGQKLLNPEYGGDGTKVGRCAEFATPLVGFPGHWAPNDVLLYRGDRFPERYQGGAFIAFHGSWNRAPLPQQGYRVAFVPFEEGQPAADDWETFANGFAGADTLRSPGAATYRPTGLAVGPDGALYVSDSQKGRIWRIRPTGRSES